MLNHRFQWQWKVYHDIRIQWWLTQTLRFKMMVLIEIPLVRERHLPLEDLRM